MTVTQDVNEIIKIWGTVLLKKNLISSTLHCIKTSCYNSTVLFQVSWIHLSRWRSRCACRRLKWKVMYIHVDRFFWPHKCLLPNRNWKRRSIYQKLIVGFEVLAAVVMKSSIFCYITPCNPLKVNRGFGGTYRLHLQGRIIYRPRYQRESRRLAEFYSEDGGDMFLRNVGWFSTGFTALYPRIWYCRK
jgi:hypothetical protein